MRLFSCWAMMILALSSVSTRAENYELVLQGGRVIDPESGLDDIRNVGIRAGKIEAIRTERLNGTVVLDVEGLVVAPGFIDLNTYQHVDPFFRLRALDGTTAVLNLEQGAIDVGGYYDDLAGKALIHYGIGVGHGLLRMEVTGDPHHQPGVAVSDAFPSEEFASRALTDDELGALRRRVETGLEQGAVAVSIGIEYTPGATQSEILAMFRLAAAYEAPAHVHMRGFDATRDWDDLFEILAGAVVGEADIHVTHVNSSAGSYTVEYLDAIAKARDAGLSITTEFYPYTAGMTAIDSAVFADWRQWDDEKFQRLEWPLTGERLTRKTFQEYRDQGGFVILHRPDPQAHEERLAACVADPFAMVASDGAWDGGHTHPRSAGTNSRVLGRFVRDRGVGSLATAVAKLSLLPARHLEGRVPAMRTKGRVQEGVDADLVVFDPRTILDQATYAQPTLPPVGIVYVVVAGTMVVQDGVVVDGVYPGTPLRGPLGPRNDR